MICFYHIGDLDGKCAGALVKREFPNCRLYGIEYGDDFPWGEVDEKTFMVDFSLSPEEMVRLNGMTNLIWIDHHASTIRRVEKAISPKVVFGLREKESAACELVWRYLCPMEAIPLVVFYLGRFDVWDHSDPLTLPFQYGARLLNLRPENQELWSELFAISDKSDLLFQSIVEKGRIVMLYEAKSATLLCDRSSFKLNFEGRKCLALNTLRASSKMFDYALHRETYDLFIAFSYQVKHWRVSLFSEKEDVSLLAIKFGGGGHPGAAGFICSELPFKL